MVPRPAFDNGARRVSSRNSKTAGNHFTLELNKPTNVVEGLLQGLGREIWVAADELLGASACLSERVYTDVVVKQTFSALSLAKGALALRNAADTLMVMQWEGITDDLEHAAEDLMEFVPLRLMQHFAGLFIFFTPLPASEIPFTAELLRHVGMALRRTAKRIEDENLIPFRNEAAEALTRSSDAFIRAGMLIGSASEDMGGGVKLPQDPRVKRGIRGKMLSDGFGDISKDLLEETQKTTRDDCKAVGELVRVHQKINQMQKQEERHRYLRELESDNYPFGKKEEKEENTERVKITVFITSAEDLRNADWGGKSDPYCTFNFSGEPIDQYKTKVIDDSLSPVWNESFEIEYIPGRHLMFEVYDKDLGPKRDDLLGKAVLKNDIYYPRGFDGNLILTESGRGNTSKLRISVFVPNSPARALTTTVPKIDPDKFPVFVYISRLQGYDGLPIAAYFQRIQDHLKHDGLGLDPRRHAEVTSYLNEMEQEFDPVRFPGKESDAKHVQLYIQRLKMSDLKRWEVVDATPLGEC